MKRLIKRFLRWRRHADWLALQRKLAGVAPLGYQDGGGYHFGRDMHADLKRIGVRDTSGVDSMEAWQ